MSVADPSSAELMRRLDEVVTELRRLADTLEEGYVRKDVLEAMNNATSIQITGLEDENRQTNKRLDKIEEQATTSRRLILTGLAYPIVVGVVVVLILSSLGLHR